MGSCEVRTAEHLFSYGQKRLLLLFLGQEAAQLGGLQHFTVNNEFRHLSFEFPST